MEDELAISMPRRSGPTFIHVDLLARKMWPPRTRHPNPHTDYVRILCGMLRRAGVESHHISIGFVVKLEDLRDSLRSRSSRKPGRAATRLLKITEHLLRKYPHKLLAPAESFR